MSSNKRLDWIDIAKGYGIVLVILAHLNKWSFNNYIYSFHLPLFFFLSGYVFKVNNNFVDFLIKKIKGLLVPYFLLGIPMVLFIALYNLKGLKGIKYYSIQLLIQKRQFTIWFLTGLFILNVLFYFVEKLFKKDVCIFIVSVIMAGLGLFYYKNGGLALPWNMDVSFTAMPFFAGGFICKNNKDKIDDLLSKKNDWLFIILFALINLVLTYINIKLSGSTLEMYFNVYGQPIITYLAAFAGIFVVVLISKKFENRIIKYIGRNSLIYFAWHQTIFMPIVDDIFILLKLDVFEPFSTVGSIVIIAKLVVILVLISICIEIIRKTKLRAYLIK